MSAYDTIKARLTAAFAMREETRDDAAGDAYLDGLIEGLGIAANLLKPSEPHTVVEPSGPQWRVALVPPGRSVLRHFSSEAEVRACVGALNAHEPSPTVHYVADCAQPAVWTDVSAAFTPWVVG